MNWRLGFKPQYITYGQVSYGCPALTPDESVSQANRGLVRTRNYIRVQVQPG